jgi:hypothetical protein
MFRLWEDYFFLRAVFFAADFAADFLAVAKRFPSLPTAVAEYVNKM